MKYTFTFIALVIFAFVGYCQSDADKGKAYEMVGEAIKLMDSGELDKSIDILKKAAKLDPKGYIYHYEMGYAYVMKKDYKKATSSLKKTLKLEGVNDQCYQMLGNTYSWSGNRKKAIEVYGKGLELYPNSGRLYVEMGNMHHDNMNKALELYETGVGLDPSYAPNYYWLAKIFCSNSTEEMWGMLYGELFMNMERGSKRTVEISELLYNTYFREINFTSDTSVSVSFCSNHIVYNKTEANILPFSLVYEPGLLFSLTGVDTITIKSLNQVRTDFISFYYDRKFNESHPNVLFEWHKLLIDKGYFESYNYWLLMKGAPEEFEIWYNENTEKFDEFINWFGRNPMVINKDNRFHRLYY